jgi:spore coat polysaccharide biosynthesis protein SpsF
MLERMLERLALVSVPHRLVLATTQAPADTPIAELGARLGVTVHRGHPTDLLDRHLGAAKALDVAVTAVAKVPSDCPLVDPRVVDLVFDRYLEARRNGRSVHYAGNLHPASWPDGNDVEVVSLEALELAHREARKPHEREHTTPFFWDQPGRFDCLPVVWSSGLDLSMSHRFTVDYPEDVAFVRAVFEALLPEKGIGFSVEDVLELLVRRPDIFALNTAYAGVNWYRDHLAELRTVDEKDTRWPHPR